MKLKWKITLTILLLIGTFIAILFYNSYNYMKFYDEAEYLGSTSFGTGTLNSTINEKTFSSFNSKLENCELAYGGQSMSSSWEIRGVENENCIVVYTYPDMKNNDCYNFGDCDGGLMTIEYKTFVCKLPYPIYHNPLEINWEELFNNDSYCMTSQK